MTRFATTRELVKGGHVALYLTQSAEARNRISAAMADIAVVEFLAGDEGPAT